MAVWGGMYFMNANTPSMEQMVFFHDHSMIVIFSMLVFLFLSLVDLINLKSLNLGLMENQIMEGVWTLLPIFLLIFIAAPSLRLLYLMEEVFIPGLTMKVIGCQWYWSYEYFEFQWSFDAFLSSDLENGDKFRLLETDDYVILPFNLLTRLLVTSVDVIHSWAVQSVGVKTDAIPGRLNQVNIFSLRPGLYFGQCSEICGSGHSFMPISLMVVSIVDFLEVFKN